MSAHLLEWLPAYHDGELSAARRQQVEEHLQICPACLSELEALESLSSLLKTDQMPALTPPDRFTAQVQLLLPHRQPGQGKPSADTMPTWVLASPLILICVWAFLQATLWIAYFFLAAGSALGLPGLQYPDPGLIDVLKSLLAINILLPLGVAILWSLWMGCWWLWQNNKQFNSGTEGSKQGARL